MKITNFTVWGKPVPKGRPRFTVRGKFVKAYTPRETARYEKSVAEAFTAAGGTKFDHPYLGLICDFYLPIPKSTPKYKQRWMITGDIRPTTKPDTDNLLKSIADSLNGIAFDDDSRVVTMTGRKWYSDEPRTEIRIYEVVR